MTDTLALFQHLKWQDAETLQYKALVTEEGDWKDWLFYYGQNGSWVSHRKATKREIRHITMQKANGLNKF